MIGLSSMTKFMRSVRGRKLSHTIPGAVVFGVAAWQSYWHTVEVATRYGEATSAYVMPLSVDGLMVVAARYITHARSRTGRVLSFAGFILGVAATVGANVMAADPNPISRVVAVWPALAMTITAGMLHWGELAPKAKPRVRRAVPTKLRSVKSA